MIKLIPDLGAPGLVTVVDVVTSEKKPTWNRPLGIGLAALGYAAAALFDTEKKPFAFLKNIGISAFPWAAESIYLYIKESREEPATTKVGEDKVRMQLNPKSQVNKRLAGSQGFRGGIGAFVEEQEILA